MYELVATTCIYIQINTFFHTAHAFDKNFQFKKYANALLPEGNCKN